MKQHLPMILASVLAVLLNLWICTKIYDAGYRHGAAHVQDIWIKQMDTITRTLAEKCKRLAEDGPQI